MSIKQKIKRLEDARLSENEIVQVLNITHLAYRRSTSTSLTLLPKGARAELYYSDIRQDISLKALAKLYKTTYMQMHAALYNKPPKRLDYSPDKAIAHLQQYDSIERFAKDFGITKRALPHVLKAIGWHAEAKPTPIVSSLAMCVLKMLKSTDPVFTHQDIATQYECARSYITIIARSHGIHRQDQRVQNWPVVLEYARTNSIAATAQKFDISRGSIYYHINKDS